MLELLIFLYYRPILEIIIVCHLVIMKSLSHTHFQTRIDDSHSTFSGFQLTMMDADSVQILEPYMPNILHIYKYLPDCCHV